jgi:RNA polymerase sigma factor (sigma-70 family)
MSDAELLRAYVEQKDEAAFRELVTRYADLVYSAALRQAVSPDLARDVAQSVFTDLARKAPSVRESLTRRDSIVGWLYGATRLAALNQLRADRRRLVRERKAMEHLEPASEPVTDWARISPLLDEAMSELTGEDRDALLQRFFKNRDFRAIGQWLGVSEDAAQKRVSRALEKLRVQLARHGITTTAFALSTMLSANAVQVVPAGLAATFSTVALAGISSTVAGTATGAKAIAMTTIQKTLVATALVVTGGAGIYETQRARHFHQEVQTIQRQQAPLIEQIQQLQQERDAATSRLALLAEETGRLKLDASELLRLRGEVSRLRTEQGRKAPTPSAQQPSPGLGTQLPSGAPVELISAGMINFSAGIDTVLQLYADVTKSQIDVADDVMALEAIISFTNTEAMTRSGLVDALDRTLLEQAGVEVTHPETNRVLMRLRQ